MCVCVWVYACVHVCLRVSACVCVCVCVCMCVCLRVCVYACVFVSACVCIFFKVHAFVCTWTESIPIPGFNQNCQVLCFQSAIRSKIIFHLMQLYFSPFFFFFCCFDAASLLNMLPDFEFYSVLGFNTSWQRVAVFQNWLDQWGDVRSCECVCVRRVSRCGRNVLQQSTTQKTSLGAFD